MYEQIVLDAFRWVMARVDQTTWNLVRDDRENLEIFFT